MFRFARFRPPRRAVGLGADNLRQGQTRAQRIRQWALWILPPVLLLVAHQVLFPPAGGFARVRYELGQVVLEEIRAPFEFSAPRPDADVERDRREGSPCPKR
jgi:hypothetical protein